MRLKDLLKVITPDEPFNVTELSYNDGCSYASKNEKIPQAWQEATVECVFVEDGKLSIEITEN